MPFLRRRGNIASEAEADASADATPDPLRLGKSVDITRPRSDTNPSPVKPAGALSEEPANDRLNGTHPSSNDTQLDPRPTEQHAQNRHRFSTLRFRNASDPHLSARLRQQATEAPPIPVPPPEIITTAPTVNFDNLTKKRSRVNLANPFRRTPASAKPNASLLSNQPQDSPRSSEAHDASKPPPISSSEAPRISGSSGNEVAAGDRISVSSGSIISSHGRKSHSSANRPHPVQAPTTSFFRRRRAKGADSLFPLDHLPRQGKASSVASARDTTASQLALGRPSFATSVSETLSSRPGSPQALSAYNGTASYPRLSFDPQANHPFLSADPNSSPSRVPKNSGIGDRSSTMSSVGDHSTDDGTLNPTGRTPLSTSRKSFGDLFAFGRSRQNSDLGLSRQGTGTPATPGSMASKANSLQLVREHVLPERRDDETAPKYVERVEKTMIRSVIASALSRGSDPFSVASLRSHMRGFPFFGDPIDMALRKLLMASELPRETQQIDRCLQAFANRYDECNPGIYATPDQAYFIAFSLLILHTDVFNKNNKHKMQKADYLKNAGGEGVFDDILEVFYDNITYTPFIRVEEDLDGNSERTVTHKPRRKPIFAVGAPETPKYSTKEPLDPYSLIIDGQLDALRPNFKDVMHLDDNYTYLGTVKSLDVKKLQNTFFQTGILQIVSARSRPDAFMTEKTATNPEEAHPGIVDIKVTKVGLLWRKDPKRRKTRSKWQEWGAILTGAQLYFFRNTAWIKTLISQYESHVKQGNDGVPIIFKPPIDQFKPDVLFSTDDAVALVDSAYKKHKHSFVYVRQGGVEEILLADDESERNDWLAKLNYAAAFRTSGIRVRGVVGGHYEGQSRRGMRRLESSDALQLVQTPTGEVSIARGLIDHKMAEDILTARREMMAERIAEAKTKLSVMEKQLELQLRNARHLQILAPIQAKTREQVLLAAARMSAELKWTRMEIWKLRCHRDILTQDLEDERKPGGPMPRLSEDLREPREAVTQEPGGGGVREASPNAQRTSPLDPAIQEASEAKESRPAPSATISHGENPPETSNAVAGPKSINATSPDASVTDDPLTKATSAKRLSNASLTPVQEAYIDFDEGEQDLLEQSGLLRTRSRTVSDSYRPSAPPGANADGAERAGQAIPVDKSDRSKIRRSLQRTLRDGAGHLSHQRSKRGKEMVPGGPQDEAGIERQLSRGVGSFVLHGKKASVINFGSELGSITHDDMRPKDKMGHDEQPQQLQRIVSSDGADDDLYASGADDHLGNGRRGSGASTSTATARSFRELHRKFSRSASVGGRLSAPSGDRSDIFGGRRSSLPYVEHALSDGDDDELSPETGASTSRSVDGNVRA